MIVFRSQWAIHLDAGKPFKSYADRCDTHYPQSLKCKVILALDCAGKHMAPRPIVVRTKPAGMETWSQILGDCHPDFWGETTVNLSFGGELTHDGQLGKPSHQQNRPLNLISTSGHTDIILFAMKLFLLRGQVKRFALSLPVSIAKVISLNSIS